MHFVQILNLCLFNYSKHGYCAQGSISFSALEVNPYYGIGQLVDRCPSRILTQNTPHVPSFCAYALVTIHFQILRIQNYPIS